ncbi:chemotaxis protein CheB [Sphingomonas sp. Leaf33]|uniref:chemotaxis protein CheB n=1 Tax=Sphingomonas sp. Leaf33 TaxID=1736215 RepID=UPI0006F6FDA1|nr:chemotaxis protein CheB [Sphingomonas sp. Leaf33]KQN25955.1 chemotaxis protein CheB [Sphingomonas sp. Leaf33]
MPALSPATTVDAPVRTVLIIDDSVVARAALGRMIDGTDRFVVVGAVSGVAPALEFLARHSVDIVLLDLELPGIDGLTGLPDLLAAGKGAKVLVVSATAGEGAIATIQALALGAADTLAKPGIGAFAGRFEEALRDKLDRLVRADDGVVAMPAASRAPPLPQIGAFDIVAIGASTGGIHALSALLRALPPEFSKPILVTQHLPASFMPYFAAQIALIAGRPCDVADNHMRLRPGRIVVAPGHAHMSLSRTSDGAAIRLSSEPTASGCLPSVDPMFASAAQVYGKRALGVVLSGMGRDGSIGAQDLLREGAAVIVQDRQTSVVWGMPGAIASTGAASAVLPPDEIGRLIALRGGTA